MAYCIIYGIIPDKERSNTQKQMEILKEAETCMKISDLFPYKHANSIFCD